MLSTLFLISNAIASPFLAPRATNDACGVQPNGTGRAVHNPDMPEHFLSHRPFHVKAEDASTPMGYYSEFKDLNSSVSELAYQGSFLLDSYNTHDCAKICNTNYGCLAFDLFYERDPSLNPAAACPNPASVTNIKCVLWGFPTTMETATNTGETRNQFKVVIAGSDAYSKTQAFAAQSVANYSGPVLLPAAINGPKASGYIGYKSFTTAFDPNTCAKACTATSEYNARHSKNPQLCRAFNIYILSRNNVPQGFVCSMYQSTDYMGVEYATNTGYSTRKPAAKYTVSYSYSYTLSSTSSNSTAPSNTTTNATTPVVPSNSTINGTQTNVTLPIVSNSTFTNVTYTNVTVY